MLAIEVSQNPSKEISYFGNITAKNIFNFKKNFNFFTTTPLFLRFL